MQFHTPESLYVRGLTRKAYKKQRLLPKDDPLWSYYERKMLEAAFRLAIPKEVGPHLAREWTMAYTYYRLEGTNIIVRFMPPGDWETYKKGEGWVYDADKCGIVLGIYLDYDHISEAEAMEVIRKLG